MISHVEAQTLLDKISRLRILVIGDVMLDHYVWGDATRISPEAPVPVVDIARDTYTAGGAANVALNIAALGARCTVAGLFADDDAGQRLARIMGGHAVATIPTPGAGATILKTRVIVQRQQLCRLDRESPPAAYAVEPRKIAPLLAGAIRSHDAVILSDYAKGLLTDGLIRAVTRLARAAGKLITLDPKPKRRLAFRDLDLITPNRKEALQLAGIEPAPGAPFPAEEVCARLHKLHRTRNLVITMSEDGMLLSSGGKITRVIPTAAREVFDVSGAGDTALASLTLALAAGAPLPAAAEFANAAAGVVVGKLGTATTTPAEILAHIGRA
ncbi:MAG: PfkB family carbohydrate kinase [Opitutaceae bacterium]|jgi:D-beta-D-heptose 7-phosphate kinase/D-beta-D-heptose 1-phosphate adenosyltransferase|nr:PfkB family carbohydrate kinase [Opitutaceae bacterium]